MEAARLRGANAHEQILRPLWARTLHGSGPTMPPAPGEPLVPPAAKLPNGRPWPVPGADGPRPAKVLRRTEAAAAAAERAAQEG